VQELDDGNSIRDLPSLTACFPFLDPKSTPRREAVKAGSMAIADERVLSWLESKVESKLPTSSETPGTLQIGQSTFYMFQESCGN
jgi:hypothetical protein